MSDQALIARLEHELSIRGHEDDCSVCQAAKQIAGCVCHGGLGDDETWSMFGCPHH